MEQLTSLLVCCAAEFRHLILGLKRREQLSKMRQEQLNGAKLQTCTLGHLSWKHWSRTFEENKCMWLYVIVWLYKSMYKANILTAAYCRNVQQKLQIAKGHEPTSPLFSSWFAEFVSQLPWGVGIWNREWLWLCFGGRPITSLCYISLFPGCWW